MRKPENCIIVIFGASGNLTERKLVPALFNLYLQDLLPDRFAILGVSRSKFSDSDFRGKMAKGIMSHIPDEDVDIKKLEDFVKNLFYIPVDTADPSDYEKVKNRLSELDESLQTGGNYIYYLSTPPSLYETIPQNLAAFDLNVQEKDSGWKRLVIEKPFGYDLESARTLNLNLQKIFQENQIYRIDHYLGKETVQNILAFRFSNGIFEPLWNRNYIHHVEITAAEFVGVGDRGGYYDGSGAMRDMVQNHLLQVLGTIAMEPPSAFNATAVRNESVKVFQSLVPLTGDDITKNVIRGQYTSSIIKGEKVKAYREEKSIPADSRTETFVAMKTFIDNWRWAGVPFYIRTGKYLPTRVTEVVIHFKEAPHGLFSNNEQCSCVENKLIIRIQPDEGILLEFGMKLPGAGLKIKRVGMDFHYSDLSDTHIPDAYERLLLDCMLGDATLYARADAVEACWEFIAPIIETWQNNPDLVVYGYPAGTWGPKEATGLFDSTEEDWRYPCKNLSVDGQFCQL